MRILEESARSPFEGIGKPESLKSNMKGAWSRRLTEEDRIVYEVHDDTIIVQSLLRHYE
jgi:toxin YoeB